MLLDGQPNPNWVRAIADRKSYIKTINEIWGFDSEKVDWDRERLIDFRDWHRVLGHNRIFMRPSTRIVIFYREYTVIDHVFRVNAPGRTVEECCQIYGNFMSALMEKLPVPGETLGECVRIPKELNEKTRAFWLGMILQSSRMCRLN
jgi:hypothetical protein